jgi:hypothetical protein
MLKFCAVLDLLVQFSEHENPLIKSATDQLKLESVLNDVFESEEHLMNYETDGEDSFYHACVDFFGAVLNFLKEKSNQNVPVWSLLSVLVRIVKERKDLQMDDKDEEIQSIIE